MEQPLPAGLGEGQIVEFVEDDEVEAREVIGEPSLAAGAGFGFKLVDEIDGGEEAPARSGPHRAEGRRVCHVGPLASARLHVVKSSSVTSEATLNRYELRFPPVRHARPHSDHYWYHCSRSGDLTT